jgi:uncharacterized protein (DUF2062 family)
MNIFRDYTFTWWQVGILKLALLSLGVAIGSYCSAAFLPYFTLLIVLGLVLGVYIAFVSFQQR